MPQKQTFVSTSEAVALLTSGQAVALPTETVYGLAAKIDLPDALKKIFQIKSRPFFDPLIVHVGSIAEAKKCVSSWPLSAEVLANQFWPGPLTLVLSKSSLIPDLVSSGLSTVGLRMPAHPLFIEILSHTGPLAAPSANKFGKTSPTKAEHVTQEYAGTVAVVDGGPCTIGIESTIVQINTDGSLSLLRPGQISTDQINQALRKGGELSATWQEPIKAQAPGMMQHHYMPACPLIISLRPIHIDKLKSEVLLRLKQMPDEVEGVPIKKPQVIESYALISLSDDPTIAARQLYSTLRDNADKDLLVLEWGPQKTHGPWSGIWDRLKKAATLILE